MFRLEGSSDNVRVVRQRAVVDISTFSDSYFGATCLSSDPVPLRICDVQHLLQLRYNRNTSILTDSDGWPRSYCYYEENAKAPSKEEHSPLTNFAPSFTEIMFDESIPSMWQELDDNAKDKLFIILHSAKFVWQRVKFCRVHDAWVKRDSFPLPHEYHSSLKSYGKKTSADEYVLGYLTRGKEKEYLSSLQETAAASFSPFKLQEFWESALTSDMRNGSAHLAIHRLLEMVCGLLSGFKEVFPKVWILNVTSPTNFDGFSVSSSSSSVPITRSCSLERKRPRMDAETEAEESEHGQGDAACKKRKRHCNSTHDHGGEKRTTLSSYNQQYVDLAVVSLDTTTEAVKYLILVEIHSKGKTEQVAEQKFTKEIIHVLQSQDSVYALFFGAKSVNLYKATRQSAGDIGIWKETYSLIEAENFVKREGYFCVGMFQKLVMDILSCILHGIKFIDV